MSDYEKIYDFGMAFMLCSVLFTLVLDVFFSSTSEFVCNRTDANLSIYTKPQTKPIPSREAYSNVAVLNFKHRSWHEEGCYHPSLKRNASLFLLDRDNNDT